MTKPVRFSSAAAKDLADIFTYIAEQYGPERAFGFTERIRTFCLGLTNVPQRGRLSGDIRPGLRMISLERRVTVAYHIAETRIVIDRIAYEGRNIEGFWRRD